MLNKKELCVLIENYARDISFNTDVMMRRLGNDASLYNDAKECAEKILILLSKVKEAEE
jgi:hypothetical protein